MPLIDLFKPKWARNNKKIRENAIKNLNNPRILARIVKKSVWDHDRELAIKNIYKPKFLIKIATGKKWDESIRMLALEQFCSIKKYLSEFGDDDNIYDDKMRIVSNLSDQSVLMKISVNDQNEEVRLEAIKRINDQSFLKRIVLDKKENFHVRIEAVKNINHPKHLNQILRYAKDPEIKAETINQISDSENYVRLITNLDYDYGPELKQISSQESLFYIAQNAKSSVIRMAAMNQLKNKSYLITLAINAHSHDEFSQYFDRLFELKYFKEIRLLVEELLKKSPQGFKLYRINILKELFVELKQEPHIPKVNSSSVHIFYYLLGGRGRWYHDFDSVVLTNEIGKLYKKNNSQIFPYIHVLLSTSHLSYSPLFNEMINVIKRKKLKGFKKELIHYIFHSSDEGRLRIASVLKHYSDTKKWAKQISGSMHDYALLANLQSPLVTKAQTKYAADIYKKYNQKCKAEFKLRSSYRDIVLPSDERKSDERESDEYLWNNGYRNPR